MKTFFSGLLAGIIIAGISGWLFMPSLMLRETISPYSLEETVNKIVENAKKEKWTISSISELDKSILKHGGAKLNPIRLINLCEPDHASKILIEEKNLPISVFMPCTISVYEKSDGKTYVGTMNAGLLGKMFGGTVAEIMGNKVALQQKNFITLK